LQRIGAVSAFARKRSHRCLDAHNAVRRKTGRSSKLDVISAKAGRLLSVTETDIEQRKAIAGLGDDDIPRITSLKSMIEYRADHGAEVLRNQLVKIAAPKLFARRGVLDQAKQGKRDHSCRRTRRQRGREEGGRPRLSIARAIVEARHGTIGFSSTEGKGTTFHFGLPIAPAQ
jgi:hypothetical protein